MAEMYFIRHGIAADPASYTTDEERPLTDDGRRKTAKVAKRLYQQGLRFDLILTSPLLRARQTADILQIGGLSPKIEESPYLAPEGNIHTWLPWLEKWRQSRLPRLALVGHQPNLGHWAEILVWGKAGDGLVLKKAGVIGLTVPAGGAPVGNSQMFWLTSPKWLLL